MTAFYSEIDPHAAQWLRNLILAGEIPDGVVDERDIRDVSGDELAGYDEVHCFAGIGVWARAVWEAEHTQGRRFARPLFTGSPPCQPLSVAGQRKGAGDNRHLWPSFHRLIAERRPATIIGEQVGGKDGREWLAAVRADLEGDGYRVAAANLPAAGFGAPHIRYRMFFVADADQGQRRRFAAAEGGFADGEARGWHEGDCRASGDSATGGLADADGFDRQKVTARDDALDQQRTAVGRRAIVAAGARADGGIGGGDHHARRGSVGSAKDVAGMAWSGPVDSFWSDPDWIFCRDNKWRPVEPGSFPLADGSAFKLGQGGAFEGKSRSGMLRGYGNAIVLPVAKAFAEAALEAVDNAPRLSEKP